VVPWFFLVHVFELDNNALFRIRKRMLLAAPRSVHWWDELFWSSDPNLGSVVGTLLPFGGAVSTLESFRCAARAVRKELFQFSFHYPLEMVSDAGSNTTLDYYVYSDKLAWEAMRMDRDGIPRAWCRQTGSVYWPAYIAWYGMVNLGHYLRRKNTLHLQTFLNQIEWLENNAVVRSDGAVIWPMNFDYFVGDLRLKAPWISAHAQGLVISALVRAWRVTSRPRLLELLRGSTRIFSIPAAENGIRITQNGNVLYTEVPGGHTPGILDGFIVSLLGLYDLLVETGEAEVARLFEEGVAGLRNTLPYWNYRDKWSWYYNRGYLSPPAYHYQHYLLLKTMARLTGDPLLADYASLWETTRLSRLDRAEIYLAFLYTKSRSRLIHRTWTQTGRTTRLKLKRARKEQAFHRLRRIFSLTDSQKNVS